MDSLLTGTNFWDKDLTDDHRGQLAVEHARAIEDSSAEVMRRAMAATHVAMYENAATPLMPVGATSTMAPLWTLQDRKIWNVLRSVIGAYAATISRSRPRPRFLASGGTGKTHRSVKRLQFLVDGLYSENKVYETGRQIVVDDALMGAGAVHVFEQDGHVRIERILPTDVLIDASAGFNGFEHAQVVGRKRLIDRDVLLAEFGDTPERQLAIINAPHEDPSGNGLKTRMVAVYEMYRRATGKVPGYHTISIRGNSTGTLLFSEKWKHHWIPIVLLLTDPAVTGVWGRSIAESVAPIQLMVDNLLTRIHKSIKVASVPRWWLPPGAINGGKSSPTTITNEVGSFVTGGQTAPQPLTSPAMTQEPITMLNMHVENAYELVGVNKNAAAGQHEVGMESGAAQRAAMELQQNRMAVRQARYEAFFVELAKITINVARACYSARKPLIVRAKVPGSRFLQTIDWSEVNDLEDTDFEVDVWPENLLAQTPGARIDTVTSLVANKVWDSSRGAAALDDLDPESEFTMERVTEMRITKQLETMLIDGISQQPTEYDDLDLALSLGLKYLHLGELEGTEPEAHLDLIREYVDAVKALQKKIAAAQAPPPQAQTQAPGPGGPMPPDQAAAPPAPPPAA